MDVEKAKIPNSKTLQAMKEADNRIGETVSYEEFMKETRVELIEK
jgi:hypothetical protein